MGVSWTEEQQQVIAARECNLLVSAAAGSGKTAVLVERIITQLTRVQAPLDVDQLLVVTYTEAAAAEMKARIRDAIEKKLEEEPENLHLQRQAALIHNARITTIHSFCLGVIRDHFHTIDLDPGFRIAEEGELKLLKYDVLAELLETVYLEGDQAFLDFVECFASGRDDRKIEEMVLRVYEFSRSNPEPKQWLNDCLATYRWEPDEEELPPYLELAKQSIYRYLEDGVGLCDRGLKICAEADGPAAYAAALESDRELFLTLRHTADFQALGDLVRGVKWQRLASIRNKEELSEEKIASVKQLREEAKELVKEIEKAYFFDPYGVQQQDIVACYPLVKVMVELVGRFEELFTNKKRERNLIDFSDMEHLALQVLTNESEGGLEPSDAARDYQDQLAEIMIDEYQDSNLLQEAILTSVSRVSRGQYNIFMVGDVKQSIYRFRLARPELFMEKFRTYQDEEHCLRVDLHKNFRSRREVLEGANYIFSRIMTEKLGGVAYDENARLNVGADYEDKSGQEVEILLLHTDLPEQIQTEESPRELEARAIAGRIRELLGQQQVLDRETGTYRLAQYRDIVILTRSLKGWTNVFAEVLKDEGIPTYTGSKEGYFETPEIGILLNYLRVLDNMQQDLPLAAVLKSCFAGLSNEQLAKIKGEYRERPFYEAVVQYAKEGPGADLRQQLKRCLKQLEDYREVLPYTSIHVLLTRIVNETGYGEYMEALPGGQQRRANIDMLLEKAAAYEATSYKGLFHFVRYIEQLKKYEVDYGEANIVSEGENAVRLMSIHKSKGLEFPVVILAGMGKRFNTQDSRERLVIHPGLGLGIDLVDAKRRTQSPTLLKRVMQKELAFENLGEELRVLYVALTRAKEKMIMIGTLTDWDKRAAGYQGIKEQELPFYLLAHGQSYFDWVLPAVLECPDELPVKIRHLTVADLLTEQVKELNERVLTRERLELWNDHQVYDPEYKEELLAQFSYRYPDRGNEHLKRKYTVSELKQFGSTPEELGEELYQDHGTEPIVPKFIQQEGKLTGALRGTAYHRVFELLDFTKEYNEDSLAEVLLQFETEGKLAKEERQCVVLRDILTFLQTTIGKRMQQAAQRGQLHKEQPFVIKAPEGYLVQGIIDVFFEEADGLVVLDYKTDRVKEGAELREKYQIQLDYYAQALARLTEKKVKEKIIYAVTIQEEVYL